MIIRAINPDIDREVLVPRLYKDLIYNYDKPKSLDNFVTLIDGVKNLLKYVIGIIDTNLPRGWSTWTLPGPEGEKDIKFYKDGRGKSFRYPFFLIR